MIYFISDVHLGLGSRAENVQREQQLITFLRKIADHCSTLYIVGDLFDYWFEYRTVIPKYFFRTLAMLDEVRSRGVEIEYLIGNHDFGHQDFFRKELDINVYPDDLVRTHESRSFYIAHGDGKVYNDKAYLLLRSVLRNRLSIKLYQWLHPDIGIRLASSTSTKSRSYTDAKDFGKPDGLADFAKRKIDEGFDFVVMGHRHTPVYQTFASGDRSGVYVNLGDWLTHHTFARFDSGTLELLTLPEFLNSA